MTTVIEAVYEGGVLRPLVAHDLREQQRYHLIVEEVRQPAAAADPVLAAELERRTTVLPDGRRIVRLGGSFADQSPEGPDDVDLVADALDAVRKERAARLEAELEEDFPAEPRR